MYVRPSAVDPPGEDGEDGGRTLFVFPFDHGTVSAAVAVREISAALNTIEPGTLLFLTSIRRLTRQRRRGHPLGHRAHHAAPHGHQPPRHPVRRPRPARRGVDRLAPGRAGPRPARPRGRKCPRGWGAHAAGGAHEAGAARAAGDAHEAGAARAAGAARGPGAALRVEIAFRAGTARGQSRIAGTAPSPLTVFFPTEKETFLGFLVQGPYRTTPARDNVPEHDPSNQALVRETAALLTGVLRGAARRWPAHGRGPDGAPAGGGAFPAGVDVPPALRRGARRAGPRGADPRGRRLPPRGRRAAGRPAPNCMSCSAPVSSVRCSAPPVRSSSRIRPSPSTCTPVLWHYLRAETGIAVITPEDVVTSATSEFLAAQPDEWVTRLYAFLYLFASLWKAPRFPGEEPGPARTRPVIRLEDGRHVAPFDADDHPAVYLPGPGGSALAHGPACHRGRARGPAVPGRAEPRRAGRRGRGAGDRPAPVRPAGHRGPGPGPARRRS